MVYFAYASAWIATAFAASVAIYVTHNGWFALVMLIPALISVEQQS